MDDKQINQNEQPVVFNPVSQIPDKPQSSNKLPKLVVFITLVLLVVSLVGLAYFYQQNQSLKQQLANQSAPTTSVEQTKPTPTPTTDTTANWKTFTHPTQHYQFKYPQEWNAAINRNAQAETLFGPSATGDKGEGGVEVREIPGLEPSNFIDLNITEVVEQKKITLNNGISGYRTVYRSMLSGINFVFKYNDGLIYNIYLNANSPTQLDTETFDTILSTFQFTDSQ